jgi:hypothetical protein
MTNETLKIYRANIAEWYCIGERALRDRMQKADVQIKNRVLTIDDIKQIIKGLGVPPNLPLHIHKILFDT